MAKRQRDRLVNVGKVTISKISGKPVVATGRRTSAASPTGAIRAVLKQFEKGEITKKQADDALQDIKRNNHTWLERNIRYLISP